MKAPTNIPKKISDTELKNMKSQLKTIITFATNLEAKLEAFLDGVGAVKEKQQTNKNDNVSKEITLRFHRSLKVNNK